MNDSVPSTVDSATQLRYIENLVYGSYLAVPAEMLGLDATSRDISFSRELFAHLDIHFDRWPSATVAGSKGKGSTAVMLASILEANGERVGIVTSPHLRAFNERIRINGVCVAVDRLYAVAREIEPAVRLIAEAIAPPQYLGPGGVILALAGVIFARAGVTTLVIEAGRGGEFDEARLIGANVSVLTPIMLEHPDKLGPTVQAIAATKARITPPGTSIVSAPQTESVREVIKDVARNLGSRFYEVGSDIRIVSREYVDRELRCSLRYGDLEYRDIHVGLEGAHQVENLSAAILAASILKSLASKDSLRDLDRAARRVRWPGRADLIQKEPWILLDGAINQESARCACIIAEQYPAKRVTSVVCIPEPKDLDGVCRELSNVADSIITTRVDAPNLRWYENAQQIASQYFEDACEIPRAEDAFATIVSRAKDGEGVILVGTQSFVGAALSFWNVPTCNIW